MTVPTHFRSVHFRFAALLISLLLIQGQARSEEPKADKDLSDLATCLTGSFSSEEQSKTDMSYFDIRLHMTRIWTDAKDGYWFYVEQARADMLDQPYRQRVYFVHRTDAGKLESAVYELPDDPLKYAGAWKDAALLKDLKPESLKKKEGCQITLTRQADESFKGGTEGKSCVSGLHGASYATSDVDIHPEYLSTWDRGFDKDGTQVWGAVKGPYHFKRLTETASH